MVFNKKFLYLTVFSIFIFSAVHASDISGRSSAFTCVSDFVFLYPKEKALLQKKQHPLSSIQKDGGWSDETILGTERLLAAIALSGLNSGPNPSTVQSGVAGVGSGALTSAIAIFGNKYLREYGYDHWSIVSEGLGNIGISWKSE